MEINVGESCFVGGLDQEFLQDLTKEVKRLNGVIGLFLAGSASQNELLWWGNADQKTLMSDIEVGVVTSDFRLRGKLKRIASKLSAKYCSEVELFLVTPRRLKLGSPKNLSFRQHSPNIIMYDIGNGANWLWRQTGLTIRKFTPAEIPPWEGIRLILNRLGEGVTCLMPWFDDDIVGDKIALERWVVKLLLALGDALLIASNSYTVGYGKRYEIWQKKCSLFQLGSEFNTMVSSAYSVRQGGIFLLNTINPENLANKSKEVLDILIKKQNNQDNNISALTNIDFWCSTFQDAPIPYRFQSPLAMADGLFDSLHILPNLYKSNFSFKIVTNSVKYRVPLQTFAYGLIAVGLLGRNTEGREWMATTLNSNSSSNKKINIFDLTKEWWDVFCK